MKTVLRLEVPHFDADGKTTGQDWLGRNCHAPAKPTKTATGKVICRVKGGKGVTRRTKRVERDLDLLDKDQSRSASRWAKKQGKKGEKDELTKEFRKANPAAAKQYDKIRGELEQEIDRRVSKLQKATEKKISAIEKDRSMVVSERDKMADDWAKKNSKSPDEWAKANPKQARVYEGLLSEFDQQKDEIERAARTDSLSLRIDSMIIDLHEIAS